MSPVLEHHTERRSGLPWLLFGCLGCAGCLVAAVIVVIALIGAGFLSFIHVADPGAPPPSPPAATPKRLRGAAPALEPPDRGWNGVVKRPSDCYLIRVTHGEALCGQCGRTMFRYNGRRQKDVSGTKLAVQETSPDPSFAM